jgi:hypothetical protein
MKREITVASIKKTTEGYLKKNPIKRRYEMTLPENTAFVNEIVGECIHGDVDALTLTVYDLFKFGVIRGMQQTKRENESMLANANVPLEKYAEVAALLADKGGAGNGEN